MTAALPSPSRAPAPSPAPLAPFPRALLALLVLLALVCRGSSLENGFVNYDDPQVRAEVASTSPAEILTGPFYYAYKPVYGLSLWLDHALYGDAPYGWHAGNVLLFALATALLALVVHGLLRSTFVAAAVAALFASHPVHAESVAWVSERKDALSLVLVLLAHLAYRRARATAPSRPSLLAPVLLALAGLAKGTVWTYAGVLVLDELVDRPGRPGRLLRLLPMCLVAGAGVVLDLWAGARVRPRRRPPPRDDVRARGRDGGRARALRGEPAVAVPPLGRLPRRPRGLLGAGGRDRRRAAGGRGGRRALDRPRAPPSRARARLRPLGARAPARSTTSSPPPRSCGPTATC